MSITGSSGSGKTTLLNILGGLDGSYQGSVSIKGNELRKMGDRAASRFRRDTVGFVFQQFNLLPHLTVQENVYVPGFFTNRKKKEAKDRAAALLDRVGLSSKLLAFPKQLSGGQQQRVAIARALFNE
ncbi:MAG: ATP-binding cassette domain-containing protein, partial [Myxococcales bacterium]|nr:ATP-binding cassette domain-containing protein [Myxococcales bacterium]